MKYAVCFSISGEVEIEAKDADEAQEKFDALTIQEIAACGELEAWEPELVDDDELEKSERAVTEIPSPL